VLRVERDQAFSLSVLPEQVERGAPIPNASGSRPDKRSVIVTDEIFGRRVPRECFGDCFGAPATSPLGSGPPQTTTAAAVNGQEQEIWIAT
jgi:hypothetical protein